MTEPISRVDEGQSDRNIFLIKCGTNIYVINSHRVHHHSSTPNFEILKTLDVISKTLRYGTTV